MSPFPVCVFKSAGDDSDVLDIRRPTYIVAGSIGRRISLAKVHEVLPQCKESAGPHRSFLVF